MLTVGTLTMAWSARVSISARVSSSPQVSRSARVFRLVILLVCYSALIAATSATNSAAATNLHESQEKPLQLLSKAWRLPTFAQCDTRLGLTCDAQGMVISIDLPHRILTGVIPKAISAFVRLTKLSLHNNHLHGSVPPELSKLTLLQELYLHHNNLTGAIPATLSLLTNLDALNLGQNALSGPIPPQLGNLKALLLLNLDENRLSGNIPETLGKLPKLQHLELGGNELTGPIPASITALGNLLTLDLSPNKLTGAIPATIGGLKNLRWMYLSGNQISGSLPPAIGNLHDLEHLWIEDNRLAGPLPDQIGSCTSLQILYLSNNSITGSLPDSLGQLRAMRDMRLDHNMISGSLAPSVGALTNLSVLGGSSDSSNGSNGSSGGGGGGPSQGVIIGVVVGALLLVTALLVGFFVWCCSREGPSPFKHVKVVDSDDFDDAGLIPSLCCRYSLVEIRRATNNWSEESRLGNGAHSDVFKGTCPYNPASTWAVKRYKQQSSHFEKEVEQIASKWHPNLAHLLGYCVDTDSRVEDGRMVQVQEQIAVYEYVHHGDLSRYLYEDTFRASFALWERVDILIGIAHGLQYLHSAGMVHGDLKPSNILIDKSWQAKVANYGLLQRNEQSAVSAGKMFGTPGYVDPVYLTSHIATKASDVFSFGVLFLELLTGRPPFIRVQEEYGEDHIHIADWAAPLIEEGKTEEFKDPHLDVPESSFLSLAELAIRCTAMPFTERPPMGEVLATLKTIRTDFFGLTDPDDAYESMGDGGGMENGIGDDHDGNDGRPEWAVSVDQA
ncbi:hypothetical protein CLOM_g21640 [Closterium sp. NIES-68]|nr:hypothetical protein CLOM_g21640 [Closterium sp. NIES-68]